MNTHTQQSPDEELEPRLENLLRSSDPYDNSLDPALARSRSQSAEIASGTYAPTISQQLPGNKANSQRPGTSVQIIPTRHQRASTRRRQAGFFALAASLTIMIGIAVVNLGDTGTEPAAPPPSVAPVPTKPAFDITKREQRAAFQAAGGKRLTGWIRASTPTDPPKLQQTGWLLNTSLVAGTGDLVTHAEDLWAPIDLSGRDTTRLGHGPESADLVVVLTEQTDLSVVVPLPGPHGIMISDPRNLATSTMGDSSSLMTLDGEFLTADIEAFTGGPLAQFARFEPANTFGNKPAGKPGVFKAQSFTSYTDPEALSCIAATTDRGNKVLAFPTGTTASGSIDADWLDEDPVALHPLRIMPKNGWLAEEASSFLLDTGSTPTANFKAWPTGETGTCGDLSGEIISFDALSK